MFSKLPVLAGPLTNKFFIMIDKALPDISTHLPCHVCFWSRGELLQFLTGAPGFPCTMLSVPLPIPFLAWRVPSPFAVPSLFVPSPRSSSILGHTGLLPNLCPWQPLQGLAYSSPLGLVR